MDNKITELKLLRQIRFPHPKGQFPLSSDPHKRIKINFLELCKKVPRSNLHQNSLTSDIPQEETRKMPRQVTLHPSFVALQCTVSNCLSGYLLVWLLRTLHL